MSLKFVGKTKNEFEVYVDLEHSHAATHIQKHPELLDYSQEIISHYEVTDDVVRFETDLGREVGKMDLVSVEERDDVFYAKRPNRTKYTKFVRGKSPVPTRFVTIDLRRSGEREYELYTVFIGNLTPHFPYGKDDPNQEARAFWTRHALVAENQDIVPGTETHECPW